MGGGLTCNKNLGFDGDNGVVGWLKLLATLVKVLSASSESLLSSR